MRSDAEQILSSLHAVAAQRTLRREDARLGQRVEAVKSYQHGRFMLTYADLLSSGRYRGAALFFLEDLYGPGDFTSRDAQFARIVPGLVRLFPREIVETVSSLGELHALSERLDTLMGVAWSRMAEDESADSSTSAVMDGVSYGLCWRSVASPADRERQIALMVLVGEALDRYTRNPLLRTSLRLMRGPAHAAGLGALQAFLERGFDTFRAMNGAKEFLQVVAQRERKLAASLFTGSPGPDTLA